MYNCTMFLQFSNTMLVKNLQKTHMSDTLYLQNLFRRTKYSLDEYSVFCSKVYDTDDKLGEYVDSIWETMAIDLLPYLFTIDCLTPQEFKSFIIFYSQYAKYADMDIAIVDDYLRNNASFNILDVFVNIVQTDVTCLVSVLIMMQYFFL